MGEEYIRRIMVLGSVPYLGPILCSDDMEDLLKWTEAGTGGNTVFEKNTSVAYNGSASLHMKTRSISAAEGDDISGYRSLYQRPGKRYRFECFFRPDAAAQSGYVYVKVKIYDGSTYHNLGIRWDEVNGAWEYIDGQGQWTAISGGSQSLTADQFHRVLFEWDQNTGKYIRMICDGLEIDLSDLSYYQSASANAQTLRLDVGMLAGASPPGELYVDDVLVLEI